MCFPFPSPNPPLIPRPLRHAAASYGHFELLEYLLSVGGDINVPDGDGETPLFTVESIETARWMLEHGSDPGLTNEEGLSVGLSPSNARQPESHAGGSRLPSI